MILAINRGSSSIKFAVYPESLDSPAVSGKLERIGLPDSAFRAWDGAHASLVDQRPALPDHQAALKTLLDWLRGRDLDLPQVACFDTAFHHSMPRMAQLYGLPRELADEGILRYGFHGLSYEYIAGEAPRGRVIAAHLGNGSSLAAIRDGVSVDTSMGFTPTGGIPMGTRSGDLDPTVVLYLIREKKVSPERVGLLVNEHSGLLGLSGLGSDVRDLLAKENESAAAAEAIA